VRLLLTLSREQEKQKIPINYQYPLSAAIYHIISKGDAAYASFLHEKGYGKGFKFFCFSQINCPFKIEGDRLRLLYNELSFYVSFHLPEAMESFVKGLFQSQQVDIADKKSKASFTVKSVESIPNPLQGHKENEIVSFQLSPLSPVVAGLQNEKGNYEFLSPEDLRFAPGIVYNWREKIKACYDDVISNAALLMVDLEFMKNPPKSRLITIKADTDAETKIRGWMNFGLKVTGEKRFVELLLDAGTGVYNSQGMGMVERCE
jgi:CRISPR-associated endoribonuclease Cas6